MNDRLEVMIKVADYLSEVKYRGLNSAQLTEVYEGLKKLTTDQVDLYAKPEYDNMQMQEIRLGREHGLTPDQMAVFMNPEISWESMNHNRVKIENANVIDKRAKANLYAQRLRNMFIVILIVTLVGTVSVGAYLFHQYQMLQNQNLILTLTADEVTLDYGAVFNPIDYVEDYTKEDGVELILPDVIDTHQIGKTEALYKIKNRVKTETAGLTINVVDQSPPDITLSNHEVTLTRGQDAFSGKAYLSSAADNADGDLTDRVTWNDPDESLNDQDITYTVTDSSGNIGRDVLTLHYKDPDPVPEPEKIIVYQNSGEPNSASTQASSSSSADSSGSAAQQSQTHGSQYFMFSDGYDMDSAYQACIAAGSAVGTYQCTPISDGDAIYTGYQLTY